MDQASELASLQLGDAEVDVQAGGSAEVTITVTLGPGAPPESAREFDLDVRGLPTGWFTPSATRVEATSAQPARAFLAIHPPRDERLTQPGVYPFQVRASSEPGRVDAVASASLVVAPPGVEARLAVLRAFFPGLYGDLGSADGLADPDNAALYRALIRHNSSNARAVRSRLLDFLPALFDDNADPDRFSSRFLLIFQSVLDPLERTIDQTDLYLDPDLTPAEFLPWLAGWVALAPDSALDETRQRLLIRDAVELARRRGTRLGLRAELELRLGGRALIVENFDGLRLGQDAALGLNTYLGERRDGSISVTFASPEPEPPVERVGALVSDAKPAYVDQTVRIVPRPNPAGGIQRG